MTLVFDHTTLGQRVLFGTGKAVEHTCAAVEGLGARRVLLVADGFATDLSDAVASQISVVARIHDIVQHVPAARARNAVAIAVETAADAVVTIGGGSATGLGKIVARDTGLPIVALPTTFAGSEATDVWGETEHGHKTTGSDPRVLPKAIVYDASVSAGLPLASAMSSGLNAVAHAVDSFWAPRADPINAALAAEGLRALVGALRGILLRPGDIDSREQALYGAYLAAVAFASAGSAMHHKICHVLGGAYNLPHAEMHAVVLPYVAAFNAPSAPAAAERIAQAVGGPAGPGLYALRQQLGSPASLAAIGFRETDIEDAARQVLKVIPPSNPHPVKLEDLERLLRAAWAGDSVEGDT